MSFTTGQLIFAGFFIVAFVIILILLYRSDKGYLNYYYKRSWVILLSILVLFALLWFLVRWLS